MTLATKNGSIIVKDGKLAENCNCCSRCKPSVMPDRIEVDIESSNESDSYGYLRFRIERNGVTLQCETEVASAIKVRGISSGTYTLTSTGSNYDEAGFGYSSDSFSIGMVVQTRQLFQWAGVFPNKFGPGISIQITPIKTVGWSRRWPTYSSLSSTVPTESDLDSVVASQTFNDGGISNTTQLSISNGQIPNYIPYAISACVGGNETFTPGTFTTVPRSRLLPWEVNASYIEPGFRFTDDYDAIKRWNGDFYQSNCGGAFPGSRGFFIDAGGDYELTSDTISNSFSNNGVVIPFRFLSYQLKIIRTLKITAIRGLMSDGTPVELINDPPQV
jgi:hypothetical protein